MAVQAKIAGWWIKNKSYGNMATSTLHVFLLNSTLFLKMKTVFIIWQEKENEINFLDIMASQIISVL